MFWSSISSNTVPGCCALLIYTPARSVRGVTCSWAAAATLVQVNNEVLSEDFKILVEKEVDVIILFCVRFSFHFSAGASSELQTLFLYTFVEVLLRLLNRKEEKYPLRQVAQS